MCSRERESEREREREREREKERETERDRERQRETERKRERERKRLPDRQIPNSEELIRYFNIRQKGFSAASHSSRGKAGIKHKKIR